MRIDKWNLKCQRYSVNLANFVTLCRVDKQGLYSTKNIHYQRYSVNVVMIAFCGPTILWMRIGKGFQREEWNQVHLGFLANPQLSTDLRCLYQLPFELGQPCYSPQHDKFSKTYVGLRSQHFPLSLAVEGVGCLIRGVFLT